MQPTMVDAATLLSHILDDEHELLTVIAGDDADADATAAIEAWMR